MAAFPLHNVWSASGTTSTWVSTNTYQAWWPPVTVPPAPTPLELARHHLALLRASPDASAAPGRHVAPRAVLAPRRTVVARGVVSWIRSGGRRPI